MESPCPKSRFLCSKLSVTQNQLVKKNLTSLFVLFLFSGLCVISFRIIQVYLVDIYLAETLHNRNKLYSDPFWYTLHVVQVSLNGSCPKRWELTCTYLSSYGRVICTTKEFIWRILIDFLKQVILSAALRNLIYYTN